MKHFKSGQMASIIFLLILPFYSYVVPGIFGGDPGCALHLIEPVLLDWILLGLFSVGVVAGVRSFMGSKVWFKVLLPILILINLPDAVFTFGSAIGTGCLDWSNY